MTCAHKPGITRMRGITAHALVVLPAVVLGVLAMIHGGVSSVLWGQQLAAWAVFALAAIPLRKAAGRLSPAAWCALLLLPLVAALFGEAAGGARRWVNLGVFHVNAAKLALPALLAMLCRMKRPWPALLAAAAFLCVQPHFAQLTALCAAALPVLWKWEGKGIWKLGGLAALGILMIVCAHKPVELEPVAYCEGILAMLGEISPLLGAAGWAALLAVPAYFAYRFVCEREMMLLSLAVYYGVSLLFGFTGEYTVMFMGFGLSSIAGYWLACAVAGRE